MGYPSPPGDVAWVRETIDQVASTFAGQKKIPLREDAKYFLLVNFAEMIVRPLRERVGSERLKHDLNHDLGILLDSIAFQDKGKQEISGHELIDALSKNWGRLDIMKLQFWG
jgi:hypothetical protein